MHLCLDHTHILSNPNILMKTFHYSKEKRAMVVYVSNFTNNIHKPTVTLHGKTFQTAN